MPCTDCKLLIFTSYELGMDWLTAPEDIDSLEPSSNIVVDALSTKENVYISNNAVLNSYMKKQGARFGKQNDIHTFFWSQHYNHEITNETPELRYTNFSNVIYHR